MNNILFLCYGNICRSPLAEHYWNTRNDTVFCQLPTAFSAGFFRKDGRKTPQWIQDVARDFNIDLINHRSRVVCSDKVISADLILVMDRTDYLNLLEEYPEAWSKTHFLGKFAGNGEFEIHDPYNMSEYETRLCFQKMIESLNGLMNVIQRCREGNRETYAIGLCRNHNL
jgi:protein-tyrosine phosphatase